MKYRIYIILNYLRAAWKQNELLGIKNTFWDRNFTFPLQKIPFL